MNAFLARVLLFAGAMEGETFHDLVLSQIDISHTMNSCNSSYDAK